MATAPSAENALDFVLHQPVRTQIVAYLVGRGEATFTELKRTLQVSDGNLESHLKKLIAAGYVATRKDSSNPRQQTVYSLTRGGESALRDYVANLQKMLGIGAKASRRPPAAKGKLAWNP